MTDVAALFDWLLDGGPGASSAVDVAGRVGDELVAAGVPVQRLAVMVTTLHPNVLGRSFTWERGQPVRVGTLTRAVRESADFTNSPVAWCLTQRREFRWRKGEPDHGFGVLANLASKGCVDYVALPMLFTDGEVHVFTVASDVGFTDEHLEAVRRINRPLTRLAEILAMRRTATNILTTYVGSHSGERVMAGRIFKGDVDVIRAAIWFSDLRGFTAMSSVRDPREMIAILNDVFDCQVPAIDQHHGEVLKFIGDGLLAIFPITGDGAAEACGAALAAARDAMRALDQLNERTQQGLRLGLALHVGDVAYGNIGGATRLDFTAIGAAVNLAARLEGIAGKLGRRTVVSAAFAAASGTPFEDLGVFELKGVADPQHVFGAAE